MEDEINVGSTLSERLRADGMEVEWVKSVEEAELQSKQKRFDLAILDVGLPDGTGFQVAERLKKSDRATALLFLTAYGAPEDRVRGLELGAEDYITKPFHLRELLLRVHNALKRARYLKSELHNAAAIGKAEFFFDRFEVKVNSETLPLSHKECALMKYLVERRGSVVSRDELIAEIWNEGDYPTTRTIDNFILRLRKWIEVEPDDPKWIRSVRGVGYQLENESK